MTPNPTRVSSLFFLHRQAKEKGVKFILPIDNYAATEFSPAATAVVTENESIPSGSMGLDIGPASLRLFEVF